MATPYAHAISDYVELGEWRGKAGGYAVQGAAQILVVQVQGSVSAVIGLPLHEVVGALARRGVVRSPPA